MVWEKMNSSCFMIVVGILLLKVVFAGFVAYPESVYRQKFKAEIEFSRLPSSAIYRAYFAQNNEKTSLRLQ